MSRKQTLKQTKFNLTVKKNGDGSAELTVYEKAIRKINNGCYSQNHDVTYYIERDGYEYNSLTGELRDPEAQERTLIRSFKQTQKNIKDCILGTPWNPKTTMFFTLDFDFEIKDKGQAIAFVKKYLNKIKRKHKDFKYVFVVCFDNENHIMHIHGLADAFPKELLATNTGHKDKLRTHYTLAGYPYDNDCTYLDIDHSPYPINKSLQTLANYITGPKNMNPGYKQMLGKSNHFLYRSRNTEKRKGKNIYMKTPKKACKNAKLISTTESEYTGKKRIYIK